MNQFRSQAIRNLLGNDVVWKYLGDELIIYTEGVSAPSDTEINNEIARLETEQKQAEADKAAAKTVAKAKLEALGLTTDDLRALGF